MMMMMIIHESMTVMLVYHWCYHTRGARRGRRHEVYFGRLALSSELICNLGKTTMSASTVSGDRGDSGYQTTLLAQSASGFNAVTSESVMMLHGNQHWVTAAGTADGVLYMDSLRSHQQITAYVAQQLLQLFATFVDDQGKLRMKIGSEYTSILETILPTVVFCCCLCHRDCGWKHSRYTGPIWRRCHAPPPGTMSRATISNCISKGVPWSVWSASQGHHCRCFSAKLWSCHVVAESWHR